MDQHGVDSKGMLGVILRLLVISLIVGVVLSALGINAANLFQSLNVLARRMYDLGFGAIDWVLQYILVGAMVVIPVWLVARILGGVRSRRD